MGSIRGRGRGLDAEWMLHQQPQHQHPPSLHSSLPTHGKSGFCWGEGGGILNTPIIGRR